jgi:hypothetical protein
VAILNLCVPPIGGRADDVRMEATPNPRAHSCAALVLAPRRKRCVAWRIRRRAASYPVYQQRPAWVSNLLETRGTNKNVKKKKVSPTFNVLNLGHGEH